MKRLNGDSVSQGCPKVNLKMKNREISKKSLQKLETGQNNVNKLFHEKMTLCTGGFKCQICPFSTAVLLKAKTHALYCGSVDKRLKRNKQLKCLECEAIFAYKKDLNYHFRSVHVVTAYSCSQCLKKLSCRDSYVKHLRYHSSKHPPKFKCDKCEYSARDGCNLRRHYKQTHRIDDVLVVSGRMDNASDEVGMVDLPEVLADEVTAVGTAMQASYVTRETLQNVTEKLLNSTKDFKVVVEGRAEEEVAQDNNLLASRPVPDTPNIDSIVPEMSDDGMDDVSVVSVRMDSVSDESGMVGCSEVSAAKVTAIGTAVEASYVTKQCVREKLQDISQDIMPAFEGRDEVVVVQDNTLPVKCSVPNTPNKDSHPNQDSLNNEIRFPPQTGLFGGKTWDELCLYEQLRETNLRDIRSKLEETKTDMGKVIEDLNKDLKESQTKSLLQRRLNVKIADSPGMRTRAQKNAFEFSESSSGGHESEVELVNDDDVEREVLISEQVDEVENTSESLEVIKNVVDHVMDRVEKSQKFKCPKCLVLFRDTFQLNRHFTSVHGEESTCKRCYTVLEDKERCFLI